MSGGELLFVCLGTVAVSLYMAVMLWLTLTYHDDQYTLTHGP